MLGQHALESAGLGHFVVPVESRMRPVLDPLDQAVLNRIEPAIVDVIVQVALVANEMLPIASLPDSALATAGPRLAEWLSCGNLLREANLDLVPAQGEIGIAGRQCPDRVHVVGEDEHGVDLEWKTASGCLDSAIQR